MSENYFTWTPKKKKQDTASDAFDQKTCERINLYGHKKKQGTVSVFSMACGHVFFHGNFL